MSGGQYCDEHTDLIQMVARTDERTKGLRLDVQALTEEFRSFKKVATNDVNKRAGLVGGIVAGVIAGLGFLVKIFGGK